MTDGSGVNHREYNVYEADRLGRDVAQAFFISINNRVKAIICNQYIITPRTCKEESYGRNS